MPVNIAIVIPTKGNFDILKKCVESIYKTRHTSFHIFIADTGSSYSEKETIKEFCREKYKVYKNISLIFYSYYNFAKINNDVILNYVSDDFDTILFCNNDIELLDDVICRMVEVYEQTPNIGTIGCKLIYSNGCIQHAGQFVSVVKHGKAIRADMGHLGYKQSDDHIYSTMREVIGNTFACAMTPLKVFKDVGGLHDKYNECFEDVHYNLKCILKGKTNIYIGDVKAYHYESYTRNKNPHQLSKIREDYYDVFMPFLCDNLDELTPIIDKF